MAGSRPLRDFALAITQLTIVPLSVAWPQDEKPDVAGWYPLVGLGLGAVAWVLAGAPVAHDSSAAYFVAIAVVGAAAVLTRGLHWDGLADTADAWYAPSVERRLEIMKDSRIGSYGALAIGFVAAAMVSCTAALLGTPGVVWLLAAPVFGRLAATCAAWIGKPARPGGLGAAVCRRPGVGGVVATAVTLALTGALVWRALGTAGAWPGLVAGVVAALVVPDLVSRRFGGVTGDTMGASVLLTEAIVLTVALFQFGV